MLMLDKEIEILKDLESYIKFSIKEDISFTSVLYTIGHDVRGLINEDECFLPRTSGYSKHVNEK